MKNIGKILLIVFSVLSLISFVMVFLAGDSAEPDSAAVNFIILISLVALALTTVAFAIYKVVDLIKHPSHTKEALYVLGALVVSLVIGLLFSDSADVVYGGGETYEGGFGSKMIGTGIFATGALILVAVVFLLIDTVKGILKG